MCRFFRLQSSREGHKVQRDHRGPGIARKRAMAFEDAAPQTEAALCIGDDGLDPCAETGELLVHPGTLGHLGHGQTSFLGEGDIAHALVFEALEVVFRGKPAVEGDLAGRGAEPLRVPVDDQRGQGRVGRIAVEYDQVGDQARSARGQ